MTAPVAEKKIYKGLAGVVVDTTAISKVVPETNSLTYRGYPVQDLAAHCSFEQVAYLLWHGELPSDGELALFNQRERASRRHRPLVAVTAGQAARHLPSDGRGAHRDQLPGRRRPGRGRQRRVRQLTPSLCACSRCCPPSWPIDMRRRRGLAPIAPHSHLSYAENFLNMCFGEVPDPVIVTAFEQSMILYAEHSFNASTFAARVVTSTQSDIYSAVTAAIGALKGPLHGGANEAVMHDMIEIGRRRRRQRSGCTASFLVKTR